MARKKPYVLMFAVLLLVGIIFTGVGVAGATGKFDFFA